MGFYLKKSISFALTMVSVGVYAADSIPELSIKKLTDNVYLYKSHATVPGFGVVSSNGLVVVKDQEAFLVDTPWKEQDTEQLVTWIAQQGLQLKGSISTHSHDDRTAGIAWLNQNNIPTFASKMTNEILASQNKVQANISFNGDSVQLFDGKIEAFYAGPGHAIDNIVVWLQDEKLLYGGCMVKSLSSKGLGYVDEADIAQWPNSIDVVLNRYSNINMVIPGHGKEGDVRLLTHTKSLLKI